MKDARPQSGVFFIHYSPMNIETLPVLDYTWHILANLNACEKRSKHNWSVVTRRFDEVGLKYELHKTEGKGKGIETAAQLCREGCRHLIVAGGDGSVNEVVHGIMTSGVEVRDVCLAVLPIGRGNDWSRTHAYPTKVEECVELFLRGTFLWHDIGKVQTLQAGREVASRYFINIAGFGFDAEVIYDTTYNKPHFLGISVYILSTLRCLFGYKNPVVEVSAPDFSFKNKVFMMVAAICQYNGGGMRQAPDAVPDDARLDVVIIPKLSPLRVLKLMMYVFSGRHIEKSKGLIKVCRVEEAVIRSEELCRGEVEGEMLETGNYKISLVPRAFRVLTNLGGRRL